MKLWERLRRSKPEPAEPEEPRRSPRIRVPLLTAYYWDGSRPCPHAVRDISENGMYVYTEERWYPGTLILMRLQREDCAEGSPERSVSVLSRVARAGSDGAGLEFVFADPQAAEKKEPVLSGGASKLEFDWFLAHLAHRVGALALQKGSKADRVDQDAASHRGAGGGRGD